MTTTEEQPRDAARDASEPTTTGAKPRGTAPAGRAGVAAKRRRRLYPVAILAIVLVGQEGCFRVMFPLPEVRGFNRTRYQPFAREDKRAQAMFERGLVYDRLRFDSEPDGVSQVHALNLYGFRGPDFNIDRPSDRRRILFLGDSITEGQGAPESETISSHFARELARDGEPAEVINLGVVAASLTELVMLARDAISVLEPTDVVVVLTANDLPAPPFLPDLAMRAQAFPRDDSARWMPRVIELFRRLGRHQPIYRRWPHPAGPARTPG
jgi:lysophospholipase L1-like esterase